MFETNNSLSNLCNAAMSKLAHYQRGDIIPHDVLEQLLRARKDSGDWKYRIRKLAALFLAMRCIVLWPENGKGYKLLTASEQIHMVPRARMKRMARQARKAIRAIDAAMSCQELSDHDRIIGSATAHGLEQAEAYVKRQLRSQSASLRASGSIWSEAEPVAAGN